MNSAELETLLALLPNLRGELIGSDFGPAPRSVTFLEDKLREASTETERVALYGLYVAECSRTGNEELYLHALRQRAGEFPTDPIALGGLAFAIAIMSPENGAGAALFAGEAMRMAALYNRLVRYSAANAARIGIMLDDYDLVNTAIKNLAEDFGNSREEDAPFEFDFLNNIDAGRCDATHLQKIREMCKLTSPGQDGP